VLFRSVDGVLSLRDWGCPPSRAVEVCGVARNERNAVMPEFAQYAALDDTDGWFRIPDGTVTDRIFNFNLPDLDPQRTVILMFKVSPSGTARLKMTVNGSPAAQIDATLTAPPTARQPRSWHEIVGGNIFKASGNHLLIEVSAVDGDSYVSISDIVFLYHANVA